MNEPNIALKRINKHYGQRQVLNDLDFTIGQAELVALLGPSGCGKSTTLKILAGLENPDSGHVEVGGKDITGVPTRKRNMGIVFQAYSLFPHMTALDNIAYGLKIRKVNTDKRKKRAEELLELVGLATHGEKYPGQMSGGQQQRVALARALSLEPEVLLLDEPLSALDAQVRGQLRDEIRRLQLSEGISTLLVTHDQEEALVMADRVGVMNEGRIVQISSPEDLYQQPQSAFVSQFVGVTNRIPGKLNRGGIEILGRVCSVVNSEELDKNAGIGMALVRPEDLDVHPSANSEMKVMGKQLRGTFTALHVQNTRTPGAIRIDMPTRKAHDISVGEFVDVRLSRGEVVVDTIRAEELRELDALGDRKRSGLNGLDKAGV